MTPASEETAASATPAGAGQPGAGRAVETNVIHTGDALAVLKTLPDNSINCVVTSPPYFGLRDYGHEDQIGLEPTPREYVAAMVAVFAEVRRVLTDDGTVFINLGDSYQTKPAGNKTPSGFSQKSKAAISGALSQYRADGQRAKPYDTSDKAPVGYQGHGCLCGNLCDVCRAVYRRTSRNDDLLAPMLIASLSATIRESMGFAPDHLPTSDLVRRVIRNVLSTEDRLKSAARVSEPPLASQASTTDESFQRLLDECLRRVSLSECLLCARSLGDCVPASVDTSAEPSALSPNIQRNELHDAQPARRNLGKDMACEYCADSASYSPPYVQPYCTTQSLPDKSLIGIPWRVAFGLQDDGWILRSDIIWSKPSCMPESVTDRPTRAHEYVFLLTKQARYWYDAEAIQERAITIGDTRHLRTDTRKIAEPMMADGGSRMRTGNPQAEYRNARTVWQITTEPTGFSHFATMPQKLVRRCIVAGCPVGGVVLDPFSGSGTTALVARREGRQYVGIELNPEYVAIAERRLAEPYTLPMLFADASPEAG